MKKTRNITLLLLVCVCIFSLFGAVSVIAQNESTEVKLVPEVQIEEVYALGTELTIQLINIGLGKIASEVKSYDESLHIHNLKIEYLHDKKPKKLVQFPDNKELEFSYKNGRVCFEIASLDIHSIIEIID